MYLNWEISCLILIRTFWLRWLLHLLERFICPFSVYSYPFVVHHPHSCLCVPLPLFLLLLLSSWCMRGKRGWQWWCRCCEKEDLMCSFSIYSKKCGIWAMRWLIDSFDAYNATKTGLFMYSLRYPFSLFLKLFFHCWRRFRIRYSLRFPGIDMTYRRIILFVQVIHNLMNILILWRRFRARILYVFNLEHNF